MFLPFRNLSTRQSAGYAVLCVVLMAGIKYLDERTPEHDPLKATDDSLAWSDMDDHAARKRRRDQSTK
ncbi:hypothetical protein Gpo141_00010284 [Globisporangium polare]